MIYHVAPEVGSRQTKIKFTHPCFKCVGQIIFYVETYYIYTEQTHVHVETCSMSVEQIMMVF
jgi:hypothetical protein